MNIKLLILVIIFWGFWGFFVKISMQKIGIQTIFWSTLSSFFVVVLYFIFAGKFHNLNLSNKGVLFAILSGVVSSFGLILFCKLLIVEKLSLVIPVSSLYPAVTVLLAVLILGDKLTLINSLGIFFAILAGLLLSIR